MVGRASLSVKPEPVKVSTVVQSMQLFTAKAIRINIGGLCTGVIIFIIIGRSTVCVMEIIRSGSSAGVVNHQEIRAGTGWREFKEETETKPGIVILSNKRNRIAIIQKDAWIRSAIRLGGKEDIPDALDAVKIIPILVTDSVKSMILGLQSGS